METNTFLANLVFIFHCIIVLFILIGPFTNIPALLILHVTFSISLLLHWHTNSDACSLTLLESKLRGMNTNETFTYKFIGPMYNINESDWSNIVYCITYIMMFISIYYIYNNKEFRKTYDCIMKTSNLFTSETLLSEKIKKYLECIAPLFIIEL